MGRRQIDFDMDNCKYHKLHLLETELPCPPLSFFRRMTVMKISTRPTILFFLSFAFVTTAFAARYQTVAQYDEGTVAAYWKVPQSFDCNTPIPDNPMAFCKGPGNIIYYASGLPLIGYAVNPDQYVNQLLQQLTSQKKLNIINRYTIPEIARHLLQIDQQMIYKKGQQTYLYAVNLEDPKINEIGITLFAINLIPNNNTPVTIVEIYGISSPMDQQRDFSALRQQLTDFMLSKRYDNRYVQMINAKHLRFLTNLRAREKAFYGSQARIHQNNMDILDQSYESYKRRGAASDRIQQQQIDAMHERRQMVNPNTGQRYQVEGHYDYNWVNPNNPDQYQQTDNALYNPDINTNQGENYDLLEED